MAGKGEFVSLGGKASSLPPSSVYAVATGQAQLRIDSSALDRLISDQNPPKSLKPSQILFNTTTSLEGRAFLTSILNKLLLFSNSTNVRQFLCNMILSCLNSNTEASIFGQIDVTEEEYCAIQKSSAVVCGICAILDYESTCLASIVDAVAAISCEAVKGNVVAFSSVDTGDGFVDKEEVGVAGDMKVLLNGSKLIGKLESEAISDIPEINGILRKAVKFMHSMTRIALNSRKKVSEDYVVPEVLTLTEAILKFGKSSYSRAKMNLDAVGIESLKTSLCDLFEKNCPNEEALWNAYKLGFDSRCKNDIAKFVHEVSTLLGFVWKIVAWEAITAYVALQGVDEKVAKRSEKKKKKTVLGKGTSVVVQLIKDRLQNKGGASSDVLQVLEQLVEDLLLFFDPKQPEFHEMVLKVKEVVESNESRRLPKIPKGTRDFANGDMMIRKRLLSIITEVFERHGATPLDTPVFELRETLLGKYGEDSKLIYDLADQGGELCSMRYDLTVPFARYVAMNGITSFKRYHIAKVYRRDNPSKGRNREFYQCDFDIAGQYEKMGPDSEILVILIEVLDELDIGDYEVKLNHRKLLDGMLEICGVPPEKFRTICSSIDKLDKQSFEQVKKEMVDKGLSVETADNIGTFVKERGHPKELLSKLKLEGSKFLENASSKRALDELEILFNVLEKSECIDRVVFDLSLARGLDYYNGVIFEAVFKGTTQVGSIAAGGRYDNLIGMFGTKQVPSVGLSLGIERIFAIMEQQIKDRNQTIRLNETQVLVSILGDDSKLDLAMMLSCQLWKAKIKTEYMTSTRFNKHIDRAKKWGIPWTVLVGDKELERGIVKIKNLETAVEEEVPRSDFVSELKKRLNI